MVASAVTELKLVRSTAERKAKELVAEADAEDRNLPDEVTDVPLRVRDRLGIAGPVRQHHPVETLRQDLVGVGRGGIDRHIATLLRQMAEDVALDSEIVESDPFLHLRRRLIERVGTK